MATRCTRLAVEAEDAAARGSPNRRVALSRIDLEDRRHVGRRFADHPQNLADRGLVFERFGQLGRAFLDLVQRLLGLVEQAHVLDRDHGLVGEGLDEADLPLVEGPDFAAPGGHDADERGVPQHRHGENGPHVFAFVEVAGRR